MYDPVPAFGRAHDPAQRRHILEKTRHHSIGGHHEILNQFCGPVFLLLDHVHDFLVDHERTKFVSLQTERPIPMTLVFKLLCNLVLQSELCLQVGGSSDLGRRRCIGVQPGS